MKKIKNFILFLSFVISTQSLWAQSESLPLNNFYRVEFLHHSQNAVLENFFPANETQMDLEHEIRDSTVLYSDFAYWLLQRHWVSVEKPNVKLYISPLIDFALGDDVNAGKSKRKLFRNVRGAFVKGEIGKRVSFLLSFAENQGRFLDFEDQYFRNSGELYVRTSGGYDKVNAVIPGGARTKDFKVDAFDYAYSIGMLNIQATKKLRFELGNQGNFVGSGYRSLLLSDNSIGAMGLRTIYQISPKWSYQWILRNNRNLYRKPKTRFVESPYENKFFSAVYLTYKPIKNLAISWYSTANSLRGDSLIRHKMQWQSWMPIPILNTDLALKNPVMNGISGFNLEFALKKWRFYGQFVADRINYPKTKLLFSEQIGVYYFDAFGIKNWWLQAEYNHVPINFYGAENPKLSYSNAQLPSAHPEGNNFHEFIIRSQYEWKRFYLQYTGIVYLTPNSATTNVWEDHSILQSIVPTIFSPHVVATTVTNYHKIELGYRWNRKYNGTVYVDFISRVSSNSVISEKWKQQAILVGVRTSLFNQYFDF